MDFRTEELKKIRDEVLDLKTSPLYSERIKNNVFPVIGEGDHHAAIMFIGEAPGRNEAKTGRPFCGAAGKVLDELLLHAGIARKEIYVTSIVKDRPPMNRDPLPEEIECYGPFLDRQINIIQPKIIATLGRYSMGYIFKKFGLLSDLTSISAMHGKVYRTTTTYGPLILLPLYHPAVAIYNIHTKDTLKKDMEILPVLLKELA